MASRGKHSSRKRSAYEADTSVPHKGVTHTDTKTPAKQKQKQGSDHLHAKVEYKGYRPTKGAQVPRINCQDITPEEFFASYVSQRRPVVIEGLLLLPEFRFSAWSNVYLMKRAGAAVVQIEEKGDEGSFGTGKAKQRMAFGDFLKKLDSGVDNMYLTTQYEEGEDEDAPRLDDLLPPPVSRLLGDFPLRPPLLRTLVPQQINMWMGHSTEGASSGLHCDFHDNLYHLLRGRKRFLLFAPSDAPNLYLQGTLHRVHANGLLAFSAGIRSDGAPIAQVRQWEITEELRKKRGGAVDEDEDAEELALEAVLEAAEWEEDEAGDRSDSDSMSNAVKKRQRGRKGEGHATKKKKMMMMMMREATHKQVSPAAVTPPSEPPSFSRIDIATLRSPLRSPLFPKLADACSMTVELQEGDALYLPASWFHEVTSYSAAAKGHLAFNYWFHPPTTASFKAPYDDGFWAARFEHLQAQIKETGKHAK